MITIESPVLLDGREPPLTPFDVMKQALMSTDQPLRADTITYFAKALGPFLATQFLVEMQNSSYYVDSSLMRQHHRALYDAAKSVHESHKFPCRRTEDAGSWPIMVEGRVQALAATVLSSSYVSVNSPGIIHGHPVYASMEIPARVVCFGADIVHLAAVVDHVLIRSTDSCPLEGCMTTGQWTVGEVTDELLEDVIHQLE